MINPFPIEDISNQDIAIPSLVDNVDVESINEDISQAAASQVPAPERVKKISKMEFKEDSFFPHFEWGIPLITMDGEMECSENEISTNSSRVFECLSRSSLSIDRQLAIFMMVRLEPNRDKTQTSSFVRAMTVNEENETIEVTYLGYWGQTKYTFSFKDANKYHIPSLAGHNDPSKYEAEMKQNPWETLTNMITESPSSKLTLASVTVTKDGREDSDWRMGLSVRGEVVVAFPMTQLDLSPAEKDTIAFDWTSDDLAKEIEELRDSLTLIVPKKISFGGKIQRFFSRLAPSGLLRKIHKLRDFDLDDHIYDLDDMHELAQYSIMLARNKSEKLEMIPKELLDMHENLVIKTKDFLAKAKSTIKEAKVKEYVI